MKQLGLTAVLGLLLSIGAVSAQNSHVHGHSSQTEPTKATTPTGDNSFEAQMSRAMEQMHRDMTVAPSGDADRDFAAMMIPHHQGAIDMAHIQLQFGKDPVLLRLAQGIIVEQLQEIDVMKRALAQRSAAPPPSASIPPISSHKAH
jgi:uncharacterized protein (DUF305 family)